MSFRRSAVLAERNIHVATQYDLLKRDIEGCKHPGHHPGPYGWVFSTVWCVYREFGFERGLSLYGLAQRHNSSQQVGDSR